MLGWLGNQPQQPQREVRQLEPPGTMGTAPPLPSQSAPPLLNYPRIDSMDKFLKNIDMYTKLVNSNQGWIAENMGRNLSDWLSQIPNRIIVKRENVYESGWEDFKDKVLKKAVFYPREDDAYEEDYDSAGGRRMRPKTRRIRRKQNKRRLTKKYI
jgi:hypothetical protein